MKQIKAEIIRDSINNNGNRLTTFIITYPYFIYPTLLKYKMFYETSFQIDNIPTKYLLTDAVENPFIPIKWYKEDAAGKLSIITDKKEISRCINNWQQARIAAIQNATVLNEFNKISRGVVNRIITPFLWNTSIITGVDFSKLFEVLVDVNAEPHLKELITLMWKAYKNTPELLKNEEWHIPFKEDINTESMEVFSKLFSQNDEEGIIKISTSILNDIIYDKENLDDIDHFKYLKNYKKLSLKSPGELFMHIAKATSFSEYKTFYNNTSSNNIKINYPNIYEGYIPYLHFII